jgi:hypothetical protein
VIVPPLPEKPVAQAPPVNRVYPISVSEGYNFDGVRELVRVYELLPDESPDWINTDSFTRNGYYYQLADITRRTDIKHMVREHTETVEIPSETNDLAGVIAGLSQTLDFANEDGYAGVLHLDIRSIEMTQDGSRSTSRTVSETREYPHLSNPDLSLIPQTITANSRDYNLANVEWRTNTVNPIDFNSVAQTYTASATYTRTATSTVATGYTTKAEYNGTLTRIATGDVRFVATFIGTPIVSTVVNRPEPSPAIINAPYCAPDEENKGVGTEVPNVENKDESVGTGTGVPDVDKQDDGNEFNGEPEVEKEIEPIISDSKTVQEDSEDEPGSAFPIWFLFSTIPLIVIIIILSVLAFCFKTKADVLEQESIRDSADALSTRMARIVRKDRAKIAAASDDDPDDFDDDEYYLDEEEDEDD